MSVPTVPVDGKGLDWPRRVANAVNRLQVIITARTTNPFEELAAAPVSPTTGRTYYDTLLNKVRTWDGTTWQNHW
jgi:hypothetical protein